MIIIAYYHNNIIFINYKVYLSLKWSYYYGLVWILESFIYFQLEKSKKSPQKSINPTGLGSSLKESGFFQPLFLKDQKKVFFPARLGFGFWQEDSFWWMHSVHGESG